MGKRRLYQYDVIRALAIAMVVAVHCLPPEWAPLIGHTSCKSLVRLSKSLFFTCNALFFMLSGRFNLRELDDEQLPVYYLRRVRGVLLPTIIYIALYTIWHAVPFTDSPLTYVEGFLNNCLGAISHGIFWFVFALFGMLLAAPFLARGFLGLSRRGQAWFMGLYVGWSALTYVAGNLGLDFNWKYPFGGFLFFFCLGGFVERSVLNDLKTRTLLVLGVASCFVNGALAYFGWTESAYDLSPFYAVTAACLYLALLRSPRADAPWLERVVGLLATHSFGIYLSHYLVLELLYDRYMPLAEMRGSLYFVCLFACVFVGGVLLAVVCERLLVKPAQRVFDRVLTRALAEQAT